MRLRRRQPDEPAPRWRPEQPAKPVHAGADITELFPPLGPIPAHVKGADITELFPKPPPHAAPAARTSLSKAAATAFGGGVYAGRGHPTT